MNLSKQGSRILDLKMRAAAQARQASSNSLLSVNGTPQSDSMADECTGAPLVDEAGARDLATLANLTEEAIVVELGKRYQQNIIYTNVGDILIALNPFKELDGLYGYDFFGLYIYIYIRGQMQKFIDAYAH